MALLREKTTNRLSYIELAIILLFSAYFILPSSSTAVSTTIALMIGLVYVAFVFMVDPPIRVLMVKILIAVVAVALMYTLLTDTKTISTAVSNYKMKQFMSKLYQYFTMYFPVLLLTRVHQLADKKQRLIVLVVALVMIAYVVVTTMRILATDADATRSWENFSEYEGENLGSYTFVYAVPIIIALATVCFIRFSAWKKVGCFIAIVFLFVFLLNAQYTLAVLISVIGIAYQVFKSIKTPVIRVLFVFVIIVFCLFIPNLLMVAIQNIKSTQITTRLNEIHTFLTGGGAGGYNLSSRLSLYWQSIQAFFSSPIWGNRTLDFDGHASFLVVLSDTGLLGAIPFFWLFFSSCKHLFALAQEDNKELIKPVFLMFTLMGLTNPVHSSLALPFATFFIAPLLIITIFNKESFENEKTVED